MIELLDILQYSGSAFGIVGGIMVAWHTRYSKYGFVLSTIASILLALWCYIGEEWGYFALNIVYLAIDIFGVYHWFKPTLEKI
jgi:hypothetical protein